MYFFFSNNVLFIKNPTRCVNWVGWAPIGAIIVWLTRLRFDDLPAKVRKTFYYSKKLCVN